MAPLLQIGDEVLPAQTAELVLRRSGRELSSRVRCPVAVCTGTLEAQVGPEGIGATHQLQVDHGRSRRAILVMAQPQPRLHIFPPRLHGPITHDTCCGTRGGTLPLSWWRR